MSVGFNARSQKRSLVVVCCVEGVISTAARSRTGLVCGGNKGKMHRLTHRCTDACMRACTHENTQIRTHAHTHTNAQTCTHTHSQTHIHTHTHTHTHTHARTHAHTHAQTHTLCHAGGAAGRRARGPSGTAQWQRQQQGHRIREAKRGAG